MDRCGFGRRWKRAAAAGISIALLATACSSDPDPADESLGMRVGGGLFDLESFEAVESELGTELHYTVQFTGRQSQKDMNGSAFGLLAADDADLPKVADRLNLSISVPLGFGRANAKSPEGRAAIAENLRLVVDGEYDQAYLRVGQRLVEAGFEDAVIRLGHEFNGAWSPWSSRNNEEAYIAAYRHVHDLLESQSMDFRFDWTAMRPGWEQWALVAYPGDDYVDIVGLDIYWKTQPGDVPWSSEVWEGEFLTVMRSHQLFAAERDKTVSYPEWGLSGADNPAFVEAMHEWLAAMPEDGPGSLEYHAYFNNNGEYSLDNFPNSEAAFVRLFGA